MTIAMFGTWNMPRPKPAANNAAATSATGDAGSARLRSASPAASSARPDTTGAAAPRRSASRPASGAASVVPSGVSMNRSPAIEASRPRAVTR